MQSSVIELKSSAFAFLLFIIGLESSILTSKNVIKELRAL